MALVCMYNMVIYQFVRCLVSGIIISFINQFTSMVYNVATKIIPNSMFFSCTYVSDKSWLHYSIITFNHNTPCSIPINLRPLKFHDTLTKY